jgi:hypothetical protein
MSNVLLAQADLGCHAALSRSMALRVVCCTTRVGMMATYSAIGRASRQWFLARTPQVRKELVCGRESIGGPFALVDHSGAPRTDPEFRGKLVLLYFGSLPFARTCVPPRAHDVHTSQMGPSATSATCPVSPPM